MGQTEEPSPFETTKEPSPFGTTEEPYPFETTKEPSPFGTTSEEPMEQSVDTEGGTDPSANDNVNPFGDSDPYASQDREQTPTNPFGDTSTDPVPNPFEPQTEPFPKEDSLEPEDDEHVPAREEVPTENPFTSENITTEEDTEVLPPEPTFDESVETDGQLTSVDPPVDPFEGQQEYSSDFKPSEPRDEEQGVEEDDRDDPELQELDSQPVGDVPPEETAQEEEDRGDSAPLEPEPNTRYSPYTDPPGEDEGNVEDPDEDVRVVEETGQDETAQTQQPVHQHHFAIQVGHRTIPISPDFGDDEQMD